jgi:hypothetical protein
MRAAPALAFLAPFSVMLWIAATILRYRRVTDFLRFASILPVCLLANMVWAYGLYEALRQARYAAAPVDAHEVLDSSPAL